VPRLPAFLALLAALVLAGCASRPYRSTSAETQLPAPVQEALPGHPATSPGPAPALPGAVAIPAPQPPLPTPLPLPPLPAPGPAYPETAGREAVLRLQPLGIADRSGWATDIHTAFAALRIPPSAENLCAAMAVIEQESTWQSDPQVPGLNRIVWAEIEKRRARYAIPKLLLDAALLKTSPDGRSYRARIDGLRTERQMNALFEDMIAELPYGRTLLADQNPVRTGGPMQVSIQFAEDLAREKPYPYPRKDSVRHEVFTRRGGLYFGIANLLDYPAGYPEPLYRFADFNAGRYSSRNAAFQAAVARLAGSKLALDGDLLRYQDGIPSGQTSATQAALYGLASRLGLSKREMDRDLREEKVPAFGGTALYRRVYALAERAAGAPLPRQRIPGIALKSPKIQRKLTTEWFARRVDGRYQTCLRRGEVALR
jgi:uncharacterized protein DUF1615